MTGGFLALALLVPLRQRPPALAEGRRVDVRRHRGRGRGPAGQPVPPVRRSSKSACSCSRGRKRGPMSPCSRCCAGPTTRWPGRSAPSPVAAPRRPTPPAARLDLVRVHADGTVHLLLAGRPAAARARRQDARRARSRPSRSTASPRSSSACSRRAAAIRPGRAVDRRVRRPEPARRDVAGEGTEFVNAERCTAARDEPAARRTGRSRSAGRRRGSGPTPCGSRRTTAPPGEVHRVIRQRDGIAAEPAAWVEVKYELKEQTRRHRPHVRPLPAGRRDGVRRRGRGRRRCCRTRRSSGRRRSRRGSAKLDAYLERPTPAPRTARRCWPSAGNSTPPAGARRRRSTPPRPLPIAAATRPAWPEDGAARAGLHAPGTFRLADVRGKPVVLVFFKPGSETTDLVARRRRRAARRGTATRAAVVPLVVFARVAAGVKDRDRLKLTVPVYDGARPETAYGVEIVARGSW